MSGFIIVKLSPDNSYDGEQGYAFSKDDLVGEYIFLSFFRFP
jgi:hypothetical protein